MEDTKKRVDFKQIEKDVKVGEVHKAGRFTLVKVEYSFNDKNYVGVGLSRQGEEDRQNDKIGYNIALSRAQKSLIKKINNKRINCVMMG